MDTREITITLPEVQIAQLDALIKSGRAKSVSEYLRKVVRKELGNQALWQETPCQESLEQILEDSTCPLTAEEIALADDMLAKLVEQASVSP